VGFTTDCDCSSLVELPTNATNDEKMAAFGLCAASLCAAEDACKDDVNVLLSCAFALEHSGMEELMGLSDLLNSVGHTCADGFGPSVCTDHWTVTVDAFEAGCPGCDDTGSSDCFDSLCHNPLCGGPLTALLGCEEYLGVADKSRVAGVRGALALCGDIDPTITCGDSGSGFPSLLVAFVTACPDCNLADPNVDLKACVHSYCDSDHACADAARPLLNCGAFISAQYEPIVDLVLSWDGFCQTNITEECSDEGVQIKFGGLMAKCHCPDLVTCSGQVCSFAGDCLAAAKDITLCNGYVSASLQAFFDAPATDCSVCTDAFVWGPAPKGSAFHDGDECCKGEQGKHGKDGTCCLRVGTTDVYKDNHGEECCYTDDSGTKKGVCGGKDFSSATRAFSGLLLVAVTILFQL